MQTIFQAGDPEIERLRGVRGWLLLFCIGLVIFRPIWTILQLIFQTLALTKLGDAVPIEFWIFYFGETTVNLALMIFGVIVGIWLWQIQPNAVRLAKIFLVSQPLALVVLAFVVGLVPLPHQSKQAIAYQYGQDLFRILMHSLIWLAYFYKSKRVAVTYAPPTEGQFVYLGVS